MPPEANNLKASFLKETREAKGLTLDIVHEATKIPMDALKAIEEGYSVRLMSPFYYRGFIKMYAEFLGVDPVIALNQYGIQSVPKPEPAVKPVIKPFKSIPRPKIAKPVQSSYVIKENLQESVSLWWQPKNRRMVMRFLGFAVAIFVLVKFVGCVSAHMKARPKSKAVVVKTPVKPKEQPRKSEEAIVPSASTDEMKIKSAVGQRVALAVRATKDTSIQVKADGKIVFQMKMKKGTMEIWNANDQIELAGKNINELDMEVNGKHIGTLGDDQRRAKKVIITKEGLSVKK